MKVHSVRGKRALFFMLLLVWGNVHAQAIKLSWDANPEKDLKYYLIFRDAKPNPEIELTKVSAQDTFYLDNDIVIGKGYYYRIAAVDSADNMSEYSDQVFVSTKNMAPIEKTELMDKPLKFELQQNYPNPFSLSKNGNRGNPATTIKFSVAEPGEITVTIYDILGREVKKLADTYFVPGRYSLLWNGKNNLGHVVSSGIYLYILKGPNVKIARKFLLIE